MKKNNFLLFQSDISDVNQIFKELGAMVHEQGEIIDSIEASVEKTEVFVGEGASQLRQASNFQVDELYIVYRLSLEYHYATSYYILFSVAASCCLLHVQYDMGPVKFDEECLRCLDQRKQDKIQCLHDPNQNNVVNQSNVRCEASRHFVNKKKESLIDELDINSKLKNVRDLCSRDIIDFKKGYQPRPNIVKKEKGHLVTDSHSILAR
jgi:predicted kinase